MLGLESARVAPSNSTSQPPPPFSGEPQHVFERHRQALDGLRAGLVDLVESPSYLMLTNDEVGPETKRKVGQSFEEAAELWPLIDAADAALSHVGATIEENGVRGRRGEEVTGLLTRRWVTIGPAGDVHSVGEVLDMFRRRYDAVQQWVTEINDLWLLLLPSIDAARKTLGRLETEVEELGVPEPLIGRARALAEDLEQRLVADPLSVVPEDGPRLDAQVAAAAAQVASMRTGRDNLDTDLATTEELLASLRVMRARAEATASEARAKVADPDGLVRVPSAAILDGEGGLAERLDNLLTDLDKGLWNQRRALLDTWLSTARKLQRQLESAEVANRHPLLLREELRGRLRAYQAKVSAVGKAEDLELTAVTDEARSELYTAPTDLEQAAATIDELARRLRT